MTWSIYTICTIILYWNATNLNYINIEHEKRILHIKYGNLCICVVCSSKVWLGCSNLNHFQMHTSPPQSTDIWFSNIYFTDLTAAYNTHTHLCCHRVFLCLVDHLAKCVSANSQTNIFTKVLVLPQLSKTPENTNRCSHTKRQKCSVSHTFWDSAVLADWTT